MPASPRFEASRWPPATAPTLLSFKNGNGDLEYVCFTSPDQPSFSWTRVDATLTSIVVLTDTGTVTTSTAHGLQPGNLVTLAGATVDTDLNGTYVVQTVGSTVTFTITTASVANNTYVEATLTAATTAPRTTAAIWSIQKLVYDAGNFNTHVQWAGGLPSAYKYIADNRAVSTGATKIDYR